jgi:hypothetical protein
MEWKRSLDFATPKGKVTAAKAIIAFANRDPDNATRACDGEAYLVVGVSRLAATIHWPHSARASARYWH